MNIHPIKAFSDNYIWLIEKDADILVVDPGESSGVLAYLKESEGKLKGILLTHKHADHTGGVEDIVSLYPDTPVYGPEETASLVDYVIKDGDTLEIIGEAFKVFKTAGNKVGYLVPRCQKAFKHSQSPTGVDESRRYCGAVGKGH